MMAIPRPPRTLGMPVLLAYTRSPGLLTRRRPAIERSQLGPVFEVDDRCLTDRCFLSPDTLNVSLLHEDLRDAFF